MLTMFCLTFFIFCYVQENPKFQSDFPVLKGPYLGQKPPGRTAEQFAVNVFDLTYQGFHSNIVFSPDGKEAYWQLKKGHRSRLQAIFESIVDSLNGIHWMLSVDLQGNLYSGIWKPQEDGKTTGDICRYHFFRDDLNGSLRPYWIEAGFIEELRKTVLNER